MDPERLEQIERLYHAALEHQQGDRAIFLREACPTDEALRREVETLLAYGTEVEGFIESPAMELAARALAQDEVLSHETAAIDGTSDRKVGCLPAQIGHYRILRLLGEGGMGTVYEAEQENPRRVVALKIVKPGLADAEMLRRFGQEAQVLGRLQDPGIAQIYEAGTADTGFGPQPYFAMEFIRGKSLRDYADEHHLNTRQRLELMAQICEAVHHAHQRGLIHRDLKPANILVDETGRPKVLDFGVARVTDSDAQTTRHTEFGQLVGTLAYMSPEQVAGDPLELDTRSDVYALGVILYELLADRLPYKISGLVYEAIQTVRAEDPAPLGSISRTYRGDIETIAAKALEKDKDRRYSSAAGLAADIRRYLNDEPIIARPPSATYQLQKFARRHRALVAGVTGMVVVLIMGIFASTLEATRAWRAEQAARTESATAKAVNDFLQNDLLSQASANQQAKPETKPDPDLKVRTALDRAAAKIEGKFREQPVVEAAIRLTIGNTYKDLGLYPNAQRQMERALDLRRRALGTENPETLSAMDDLAVAYSHEGKYTQAEPLLRKVLEVYTRVLGPENLNTLQAMNNLATLYEDEGKDAQTEPLLRKVLQVTVRVLGAEHPHTLATMSNLAGLYRHEGKYAEAESSYSNVLQVAVRVLGAEHPNTLISMTNLGVLYLDQGKYAQAEPLLSKVLDVQRRVLGEEHPDTLTSMASVGALYRYQGKYSQAEPLFRKMLEVRRRVLGEEHPNTLLSMASLALVYDDQGKYAQAEPLFNKALEVQHRVLGKEHPETLRTMANLAALYRDQGKYEQSQTVYSSVLEARRRVLGTQHPDTLKTMHNLAIVYFKQRKYPQVEVLLRQALNGYEKAIPDAWERYHSQSMLGASLAGQRKYAEAEPLVVSGYEEMLDREAKSPPGGQSNLKEAGAWIVQLYKDWGKPEKAADWTQKLHATKRAASPKQAAYR